MRHMICINLDASVDRLTFVFTENPRYSNIHHSIVAYLEPVKSSDGSPRTLDFMLIYQILIDHGIGRQLAAQLAANIPPPDHDGRITFIVDESQLRAHIRKY